VLGGGEDYELLFTVRPAAPAAEALARRRRLRVRGAPKTVPGWRHF
jgi:hypothetical protein